MLDRGVAVADVAEIVDLLGGEEGAGGEGVDGCIAPLEKECQRCSCHDGFAVRGGMVSLTRSIQKPPLRSIILKKSSYS